MTVRCAHGKMVLYPLAEVEMELDGVKMIVQAAISDTLPVSMLRCAELGRLLRANPSMVRTEGVEEALVVTARAQQRKKEMEEALQRCQGQGQAYLRSKKRRLSRKETRWRKGQS